MVVATGRRAMVRMVSGILRRGSNGGLWSQIPLRVWFLEPESLNIGYLDPLGYAPDCRALGGFGWAAAPPRARSSNTSALGGSSWIR